jgi:hypothetical protein
VEHRAGVTGVGVTHPVLERPRAPRFRALRHGDFDCKPQAE